MSNRSLIPDDQIIVVLDTSPARNLAHEDTPEWLDTFIEMSESGYSFSLSEVAGGELMVQYRSGRIPHEDYFKMLDSLEKFLNPKMPVIPGKLDIELMIGIQHDEADIEETLELATRAWDLLCCPLEADMNIGPSFETLIEQERLEWNEFLETIAITTMVHGVEISEKNPDQTSQFLLKCMADKFYPGVDIDPPMSTRMHLELLYRFRQSARTQLSKKPYNPQNKNKKNDGIDVNLYRYLILPALVVADDKGFFNSIKNIESFQVNWFFRPKELAKAWLDGLSPQPVWPEPEN